MAVELKMETQSGHRVLVVNVSGKLSQADYEHFVPEVEKLIREQGKVRLLFAMRDFHGWEAGALWEDIKFDFRHHADIERLRSSVKRSGNNGWPHSASRLLRPRYAISISMKSKTPGDGSPATRAGSQSSNGC